MRLERMIKEVDELKGERRSRWKQRRKYRAYIGERELNQLDKKETMSRRLEWKKKQRQKNR
jgi:hypothetical protein